MTHLTITIPPEPTDAQLEAVAWQAFAQLHPHEAYAAHPERFWQFFQEQAPGTSRAEMEALLRDTQEEA